MLNPQGNVTPISSASLGVSSEGVTPGLQNLLINLTGAALFAWLYSTDSKGAAQRVVARKAVRQAQIRAGDREVFVNEQGETMSRLKEVRGLFVFCGFGEGVA